MVSETIHLLARAVTYMLLVSTVVAGSISLLVVVYALGHYIIHRRIR